jgi:hypothetical protein
VVLGYDNDVAADYDNDDFTADKNLARVAVGYGSDKLRLRLRMAVPFDSAAKAFLETHFWLVAQMLFRSRNVSE